MSARTASGVVAAITIGFAASIASAGATEPRSFDFPVPDIGTKFFFDTGIYPGAEPYAGHLVTGGRVSLTVEITEIPGEPGGSDASNFYTEIIFPVDTNPATPEVEPYYAYISGDEEGWTGLGTFTIERELPELAGSTFVVPLFFTATTYSDGVNGSIDFGDGFWTLDVVPAPGTVGILSLAGIGAMRRRRH